MIIPIDRFFQEMTLTDDEKKRREDMAYAMFSFFQLFFVEILAEHELDKTIDKTYYNDMLYRRYREETEVYIVLVAALLGRDNIGRELEEHIKERISYIVDTTVDHIEETFYTSDDRATMLSCNEANYVGNDVGQDIAVNQGYTRKQWLTIGDEKVRPTHVPVDHQIIGINEYFKVGNSEMLYPMDMSRNAPPEETMNCRCGISYLR